MSEIGSLLQGQQTRVSVTVLRLDYFWLTSVETPVIEVVFDYL